MPGGRRRHTPPAVALFAAILAVATACGAAGPVAPTATPADEPAASPTQPPATATLEPSPEPTAAATSTSTPVPEDESWLALERDLWALVEDYGVPGLYAVAVTDLQTGLTLEVNGDRRQLSACVINFFVLLAVMLDVEAGTYPFAEVETAFTTTIWGSNAATARQLVLATGGGDLEAGILKVRDLIASLGLYNTVFDHPPAYPDDRPGCTVGENTDNWITALEANQALGRLYHGEVLGEPWRTDFLDRLTRVSPGLNYLTAYGPEGRISHKNGFFPNAGGWVDNDIGIVRFERAGSEYAYAISFFSQDVPWKYGDIPLGQAISLRTWRYFSQAYPREVE